jgi:hypothetical protein
VGIWAGVVELNDLRIKKEILDSLALPISIKMGYVGKLRLEVPWSSLWSSQLKIVLDQVLIISGPAHKDTFDVDQETQRLKRVKAKTILGAELYQKALEEAEDESSAASEPQHASQAAAPSSESRLENFLGSLIRNALIEVRRVHIRYEDGQSASSRTIAFGLTLNSLSVHTEATEEAYKANFTQLAQTLAQRIHQAAEKMGTTDLDEAELKSHFTPLFPTPLAAIFKTISINDLAVYFNSRDSLFLPEKVTIDTLISQDAMPTTTMTKPIPVTIPSESERKEEGNEDAASETDVPVVLEQSVERIIRRMLAMISRSSSGGNTAEGPRSTEAANLQFLLEPISLEVSVKTHARIGKNPIYAEPNLSFIVTTKPVSKVPVEEREGEAPLQPLRQAISIHIDQDQLVSLGSVSTTLSALAVKRRFAQFKPRVSATENPRAWWLFLRQSLFHDIQQRKERQSLAFIDRRRAMRIKYVAIYREKTLKEWGFTQDPLPNHAPSSPFAFASNATPTYLQYQLDSMEGQLLADDIIFFRAFARMQLESEGLVKPSTDASKQQSSLFSKVFSWSGLGRKAQPGTANLNTKSSPFHISRLEDDAPLPHSLPWVQKLRLSIDSSDPTSSWVSSHSIFARRIDPKFRFVHPDYAQIAGSVSLPSIQVNLMQLLLPNPPKTGKQGRDVKLHFAQFASRVPLGRLEVLGTRIHVEVKPTHRTTSLRAGVGALLLTDLSQPSSPSPVIQYRSGDQQLNLIDLSLELNPYSRQDGSLLPYDMAVEAKIRRFEIFADIPFFITLARVYASPANRSFEKILDSAATLEKLKKVTRRTSFAKHLGARGSASSAILLDVALQLPALLIKPNQPIEGAPLVPGDPKPQRSSVMVLDLGKIEIKSSMTFPDLPSVASHSALMKESEIISSATVGSDSTLDSTLTGSRQHNHAEKVKAARDRLSGETDGRKARKILRDIFGHLPLHICARWVNTLFVSWQGLSAVVGDVPFGSETAALQDLLVESDSLTDDDLRRLNYHHSNFQHAKLRPHPFTQYLIVPALPTRIVVKISSNPLMFFSEANLALKHGASSSHGHLSPEEASDARKKKEISKMSIYISLARISLQTDPESVSRIMKLVNSMLPPKSKSHAHAAPEVEALPVSQPFEPSDTSGYDFAHQLMPSRQSIMFGPQSPQNFDFDDSSISDSSSSISSASVPTISIEPAPSSSSSSVGSPVFPPPPEKEGTVGETLKALKRKSRFKTSKMRRWMASSLTLKLLFRGLSVNLFSERHPAVWDGFPEMACIMAIGLSDCRVSMASKSGPRSEIRASIGSLLVHTPSPTGQFAFSTSLPQGHYQSTGWEKRWVNQKTDASARSTMHASWLNAPFAESHESSKSAKAAQLSSQWCPLVAMGAAVYGLPSSIFLECESTAGSSPSNSSFLKASKLSPASKAYSATGNERLASVKLDLDGGDVMAPISAIKAHVGALIICAEPSAITLLLSDIIKQYLPGIKSSKKIPLSAEEELDVAPAPTPNADDSPKKGKTSVATWLEAAPALHLRVSMTGLALVLPIFTAQQANPVPALAFAVSNVKASMDSISKKGDMQLLASVGSLDFMIDGLVPQKLDMASVPSIPLPQSIISVRDFLEPKKKTFKSSSEGDSEARFLILQIVSRAHSVKKEYAKRKDKDEELDGTSEAESTLLLEGPWNQKISARMSRLSVCVSPTLAPTLISLALHLSGHLNQLQETLKSLKEPTSSGTSKRKSLSVPKASIAAKKPDSAFSIPKFNVRLDLPEIIVPLSPIDPQAVRKLKSPYMDILTAYYAGNLQRGISRSLHIQLGSIVATDGYSTASTMNPSGPSDSKPNAPYDLHIMVIWKGLNVSLSDTASDFKNRVDEEVLARLVPLSVDDFPFAVDHQVMDSILIQQAPITIHISKKQFFGEVNSSSSQINNGWETLPQVVLETMKLRVEAQVEPIRIRLADHILRQLTILAPSHLIPIVAESKKSLSQLVERIETNSHPTAQTSPSAKVTSPKLDSSATPTSASPIFLSLRLKLLSIETYQSIYGPNRSDASNAFQDLLARPLCLVKTSSVSLADINLILARFHGLNHEQERAEQFREDLTNIDAHVGAISILMAAHPNTDQVASSICAMQAKWIAQNQQTVAATNSPASLPGRRSHSHQASPLNGSQASLVNWCPYSAPGQIEGSTPELSFIGSTWLLRSLILSPPLVQLVGPRSLIYSSELAHEKPMTPLIKSHILISKTFKRSDFVLPVNPMEDDEDIPEPLLRPEPSSSAPSEAQEPLFSRGQKNPSSGPLSWSCHTETQVTLEVDDLRAVSNAEAIDHMLQYCQKSILPSVTHLQTTVTKLDLSPSQSSKTSTEAKAGDSASAAPSSSAPSQSQSEKLKSTSGEIPESSTDDSIPSTSHMRALISVSAVSVQIPATSRLPAENPVEVPPRHIVPSLVVELGLNAEISLMKTASKRRSSKIRTKTGNKPSIKASALLHSLQLYRSAYGQSLHAGASNSLSSSLVHPHRPNIVLSSLAKGIPVANATDKAPKKKKTNIDVLLQSPALQSPDSAKDVGASHSYDQLPKRRPNTYSHSVGAVGRLFTQTTQSPPGSVVEGDIASVQAKNNWPIAGKLGWRHAVAENAPLSGPSFSSSRVAILDPASLSVTVNLLPSGSLDASVIAEPLYLKFSNRDALASMAIIQSILSSPLLSTVKDITSSLGASKAAKPSDSIVVKTEKAPKDEVVHHLSRMIKASLGGVRILVLEDGNRSGQEIPLLNVQLDTVLAEAHIRSLLVQPDAAPVFAGLSSSNWKEEISASLSLELRAGYYDQRGAFWETLIDSWRLDAHIDRTSLKSVTPISGSSQGDAPLSLSKQQFRIVPDSEVPPVLDVWARSEQRIEITLTSELLKLLQRTKGKWKLNEWRLALENFSMRHKDISSSSRSTERKFAAPSLQKMGNSAQGTNTPLSSSSASLLSGSSYRLPVDGTRTPHSLLSSVVGSTSTSALRTPGGMSRASIAPPHQIVLVNKTGLPLSYALPPSLFNSPLGSSMAHVLAIDSQISLPSDSLVLGDPMVPNAPTTVSSLTIQFGAYNPVSGIPIFERIAQSSTTPTVGSCVPISGTKFFQVTRSLPREPEVALPGPSAVGDGNNSDSSSRDSHILLVDYTTIDLVTFITVRGTALFVNDCKTKNVRVGHSGLKSILEHHLLPAGSSWPIPFQWLDECILNDLLYAHHLSRTEKALHKARNDPERGHSFEDDVAAHLQLPPASKSQLSIDFQTLTSAMLIETMTAKGVAPNSEGLSTSRKSPRPPSPSAIQAAAVIPRTPFALTVQYQTRGDEQLKNLALFGDHNNSNVHKASISTRELEVMSRMLPDFGASSLPLAIHIRPSLILENLLPVSIDMRVLDRDTAKTIVQENSVPMGKQIEVFHERMDHALLLSIRFQGSTTWTDDVLINTQKAAGTWQNQDLALNKTRSGGPKQLVHVDAENTDEKLATNILIRDDSDPSRMVKTHVMLEYKRPQLQVLQLSLYASFWIENKTGLPLEFAFVDDPALIRPPVSHSPSSAATSGTNAESDLTMTNEFLDDAAATPSIHALLPHQSALRHLGGVNNVYPQSASTSDDLCTIIDQTRIMPLFASFPDPMSSSLSLFVHWVRRPPTAPHRVDPLLPQEDLEGYSRHWSAGLDFSAFLPTQSKSAPLDLSSPMHLRIPFSTSLNIHLSLVIERCTGAFRQSFKLSVVPRLFLANASSPLINARFMFFSTGNSERPQTLETSQTQTPGNANAKEISVVLRSNAESNAPAMPLYLLPTKDTKLEDLAVSFQIWRDLQRNDLELGSMPAPLLEPFDVMPIILNMPQTKLTNMTTTTEGLSRTRGMARIELTRVDPVAGSSVFSSYLLAIATSSSFFEESLSNSMAEEGLSAASIENAESAAYQAPSIAFELSPYWITNSTPYWLKVSQANDPKAKKGKQQIFLTSVAPATLLIAPNSSLPFTWDYPELNHFVNIWIWNHKEAAPLEAVAAATSSDWISLHSRLELDATMKQIPLHLTGALGTSKVRIKEIKLKDVAGVLASDAWHRAPNQLIGVQVAADGPRRHLKLFDLSATPFQSAEQHFALSGPSSSSSPESKASKKKKRSGTINLKVFLGGLGLSVVHSKKRLVSHLQPHNLFNTTSSIEDSAELVYFVLAGLHANVEKTPQQSKLEVHIEALQLDCPDHAKLNTPNPVIITSMLDDVSDSNTGSTDRSANEKISPHALSIDMIIPASPEPSQLGTHVPTQAKATQGQQGAKSATVFKLEYLSFSLRPLTISLDQSFIEIMLSFVSDSLIVEPTYASVNAMKKMPTATFKQDQLLAKRDGYPQQLDVSQLTYGITSAVPVILPDSVLSSSTKAMASSDSKRLISSGLALFKQPIWIGALVIRPLMLRVTVTSGSTNSSTERVQTGYDASRSSVFDYFSANRFIRALGAGAGGIDGLKLRFGAVGISRVLVTPKELTRMMAKTYAPRAALQALKVLGSLNFAGTPWLMIENLSEGFSDLLVDPMRTESDHGGYFTGAVHGAQNLLIKSLFGVSTSTSNASGSVAKFLSELNDSGVSSSNPVTSTQATSSTQRMIANERYDKEAGDVCGANVDSEDELSLDLLLHGHNGLGSRSAEPRATKAASGVHQRRSKRYRMAYGPDAPGSTAEGLLASSVVTLSKSLLGGAVGLVMDPIRGWKRAGTRGAVLGLTAGVAGVVLKPTQAIAQIIHDSADHLRLSAQRPPPSLFRAPRIPMLQIEATQRSTTNGGASSPLANPNAHANPSSLSEYLLAPRESGDMAEPSNITSSILNYILKSSTTFYSRRWDSYDGQRSIGQCLLAKVAREKYNAEITYHGHYGSVSMLGEYVHHWFVPASPMALNASNAQADASDTYWILTTRCFIKIVPPGSGVPFDSSLERIGQIGLLLTAPLDIRYILLLSNIASASFDRPRRSHGSGSSVNVSVDPSVPSTVLYITLNRFVASTLEFSENSAQMDEEDTTDAKSYRKVKLASADDVLHLASLLAPRSILPK